MSFFEKIKNSVENETNEELAEKNDFELKELEKTIQPPKKTRRAKKIKPEVGKPLPRETKPLERTESKKWPEPEGQLAVDVYQTDNELIIQTAIAGVKPEDLDITAQGDTVIIRGRREKIKESKGENYFYQECYWGSFSREIILPVEADTARAQASMAEGILTIRIPKIVREGTKKISVK